MPTSNPALFDWHFPAIGFETNLGQIHFVRSFAEGPASVSLGKGHKFPGFFAPAARQPSNRDAKDFTWYAAQIMPIPREPGCAAWWRNHLSTQGSDMQKQISVSYFGSLILVAVSLGCGTSQSDQPAKTSQAKEAKGDSSMLEISVAEATDHQLPAVAISLDTADTGLAGAKFAEEGQFLRLSGPPGGPLGMEIELVKDVAATEEALGQFALQRFEGQTPDVGSSATVDIAGGSHLAVTCSAGSSMAKATHLLVLIPAPNSNASLLVDFWKGTRGADVRSPESMIADSQYSELLKSLSIRFE